MSRVPFPLRSARCAALLVPALALGACATTGGAGVEVTRFHLAAPIAPASFTIQNVPTMGMPAAPDSLEYQSYDGIVAGQLTRLGFTPAPDPASAEEVVTVEVQRATREGMGRPGPSVGIGLGGASFGRGGGVGLGGGVSFPVGHQRSRYVVGTRLVVRIKRRSEGTVIWEGRATTEARADAPAAQPDAAVAKLASALFAGFPGESGRTITVR